MNKNLYFLFSIVFIYSCKNEQDKQKEEFLKLGKIYFTEEIKKNSDMKNLDSLRIFKIDTLTKKDELKYYESYLLNYSDYLLDQTENTKRIAELKYESANLGAELYGGYVNKLEYKNAKEKEEEFIEYRDSARLVIKNGEYIHDLVKKADSIKLDQYEVGYICQITNKNMTMKKDTVYLQFSIDKKIIDKEEYRNNLKKKYPLK